MKTVLITGGSGLVGMRLTALLLEKGYSVAHLSRSAKVIPGIQNYCWDIEKQKVDAEAIEKADFIVHLAGESIVAKKWTSARKAAILNSRVKSLELLNKAISTSHHKPEALISASAIGYYGFSGAEKIFNESNAPGVDFAASTCVAWENAALTFEQKMRTVRIRLGIVLSAKGGALPQMALPIKLFVGSAIGNGNQYVPWIHIDDVCYIFIKAIEDTQMKGVYNAVAPHQAITQKVLTKTLAGVLQRPLFLPRVPEFLMKIILGSRAYLVLNGNRVSAEKLEKTGFHFVFTDLKSALKNIYKHS